MVNKAQKVQLVQDLIGRARELPYADFVGLSTLHKRINAVISNISAEEEQKTRWSKQLRDIHHTREFIYGENMPPDYVRVPMYSSLPGLLPQEKATNKEIWEKGQRELLTFLEIMLLDVQDFDPAVTRAC